MGKYELVVGLDKGHKVIKNDRKPKPSSQKGVSTLNKEDGRLSLPVAGTCFLSFLTTYV